GVNVWAMKLTMKLDTIERHNFPVVVQENLQTFPLLGQSFYKDFTFTIEPCIDGQFDGFIHFVRKGPTSRTSVAAAANDPNSVAVSLVGNGLVVEATVSGHTTTMYFDTGAEGVVFSEPQLRSINVNIPPDALITQSTGVAGTTATRPFNLSSIRLGPIQKNDIQVQAVAQSNMQFPLLGQEFFAGWQVTVDTVHNRIHFLRR